MLQWEVLNLQGMENKLFAYRQKFSEGLISWTEAVLQLQNQQGTKLLALSYKTSGDHLSSSILFEHTEELHNYSLYLYQLQDTGIPWRYCGFGFRPP